MNRPSFEKTVDVLVKAYLNDTLRHGDCYACAVGNIIAASIGCEFVKAREGMPAKLKNEWMKDGQYYEPIWTAVFGTNCTGKQEKSPKRYVGVYKKQIDVTGYSWQELAKIEKAFEAEYYHYAGYRTIEEEMFNGLMAVVDVLAEIHKIDLTVKEQAKQLFVKA